ncbi:sex peptide receptor isoform X1 [Rhipicephalus microplus]|uniref:sex peptide receptor isoform X1 n=1 Tax=Rhipicephalus microplus TaxID=6941 RepID=UPI003F6CE70B
MTKADEDIIMDYDSGPNTNGISQDGDSSSAPGANQEFDADVVPLAANVTGLLNLTSREAPIQFTLPLLGYAMPLLLVVTIIANTLIVVVLSQRHMRTPTNIVLLGMAICDMLTLLVPSPWYFYIYSLGNYERMITPASACYAYNSMHEVIPNFFHTSSIWLTLLLAGQRYIYVCRPARARDWCTVPNVTRAMCWIMALAFAHQLPRFFDRTFEDVQFRWNDEVLWGCSMRTASWVRTVFAEHAYFIAYYAFKVIFVNTGPCTALVVLNLLLFKALKRARNKRLRLFQELRRKSDSKRHRDRNCTTMMLIIVVTVFLVVEIPLVVTVLLHVLINTIRVRTVSYESLNIVILFSNFFIMLSYPVNFAIYCGMSRQFRETFKDLFLVGSVINRRENSSRYSMINGPRPSANETLL